MYLVSVPDGLRCSFRKTEKSYFSFFHEVGHCPHRLLDWNFSVHPVLIIKINYRNAQTLQAGLALLLHVFRTAAHANPASIRRAHVAELGGKEYLVAAALDRPAHKLLVVPYAIHVSSVEKIDSQIESTMDGRNRFVVIA